MRWFYGSNQDEDKFKYIRYKHASNYAFVFVT